MHREFIRRVPGSKMAVLMIHGIVGTPNHFTPFLPLFPESWSVYNILLEGHGGSVRDFSAASMKKWKAQVFAALEEILANSDRVMILGHSMGCLFAVEAAVRYPGRVCQLFLLSIPLRLRIPLSTVGATMRIACGRVRPQDTVAQTMCADGGVALETGFWKYIPWIPRFAELLVQMAATEKLLHALTVPVKAYHGLRDELVGEGSCDILQKRADIRAVKLPDSGHFTYGEQDLLCLKEDLGNLIRHYEA